MCEDARDGVAAAVVVAEDLAEEAPDGGDGAEDAVAEGDAVLLQRVENAVPAQGIGEGQTLVARKASADLLQSGHGNLECLRGAPGGHGAVLPEW